jgi:hypothetical protein
MNAFESTYAPILKEVMNYANSVLGEQGICGVTFSAQL